MKDLYSILGLNKNATEDEIRKAYRTLARQYHPDRNPGDKGAEDKFKEVASAYEILGDKNKKHDYDRFGSVGSSRDYQGDNPFRNPFGRGKPFTSNMDDFFASFFGEQQRASKDHADIIADVYLTLGQVFNGGKINVKFPQKSICTTCAGSGGSEDNCTHCDGKGTRIVEGKAMTVRVSCSACEGKGKIRSSICADCLNGYVSSQDGSVSFDIPLGVETGMSFIHRGLGNPTQSGASGNLIINVRVEEHELFKRVNQGDLFLIVPINYSKMVLGGDIDVPTLDGMVSLKIPPGVKNGTKFKLSGKGLHKFNNKTSNHPHSRGDQFVLVELEIPKNISDQHKEILQELIKLEDQEVSAQRKEYLEKVDKLWTQKAN